MCLGRPGADDAGADHGAGSMFFLHSSVRRCLTWLVMELRQLRYFVAVADELHFTRAAARLRITAPSLSQQVKALERGWGVRLFDRSSSGVRLTEAGALLLPLARRALLAADELADSADRLAQGQTSLLRLGFLSFALTEPVRRLLTEFGRAEPTVDLQLRQFEWEDPSAGLLDGSSDAAIVRLPFTGSEALNTVEVGRDRLLAIMAEDHPLATLEAVSARRLAREPFLESRIVTDSTFARHWYLHEMRGPAAPVVLSSARTVEEWLGEVALRRCVNLVPAGVADAYRKPGLAFVPVEDLEPSVVALAWRSGQETGAVERLARLARRVTRTATPTPPPVPA